MSNTISAGALLANSYYMDVISNNIANASTTGYKASIPIFFSISSPSGDKNNNLNSGVEIIDVIHDFSNGPLINTGRDLDLSVTNNSFFRLADSTGKLFFTKNGQFFLDKNKNIVNAQGMYLIGKNIKYSKYQPEQQSNLEPINLKDSYIFQGKKTSKIILNTILNSNNGDLVNESDVLANSSQFDKYTTYIDVYDHEIEKKQINISFKKINQHTWKVNIDAKELIEDKDKKDAKYTFELRFDSDGTLISDKIFKIPTNNLKHEALTLDFNNTIEQPNSENSCNYDQDGSGKGILKTFNILPNGEIVGIYSNHTKQLISQIFLSQFINPDKLKHESGSAWSLTEKSGPERIGKSGDPGFGVLVPNTLEASNVDLNKELINMIIAQRNYQSNVQSFKTEDSMISTLINLK